MSRDKVELELTKMECWAIKFSMQALGKVLGELPHLISFEGDMEGYIKAVKSLAIKMEKALVRNLT